MPFRSDQSDLSKSTPLDYVKYAFGVLAALLLVPALLQGLLAFLQTFLQTLLSIVLTLNLLVLSAVAGVAGVWIWQRRVLASSGEVVTIDPIDPTVSVESSRQHSPVFAQGALAPQTPQTLAQDAQDTTDLIVASSLGDGDLDQRNPLDPDDSPPPGFAALKISSTISLSDVIPVTIPDVVSETLRSPSDLRLAPPSDPSQPEPLIQAQLARRLGVSSSTIGVRKLKPDFGEWSSQKDPAGLAWRYCEEVRQFFVMSA
ncbi:MAG: hypothetical protein HC795_10795 [Coleofasciculaceae cyanobacterium RL_1_1]|nr:hypothetical protein [Coleofasciculaceae cyanobacterium RL_1_1]